MLPKPEAIELYRKNQQEFKCELVEEKAIEPMVSFYTTGKFIDFCRGPHIPSTGRIKAFKLMNVAGRLLEGPGRQSADAADLRRLFRRRRRSSTNICTSSKKPSAAIIAGSGTELDLFSIQDEAGPGLIFWHPKGGSDPQTDGGLVARRAPAPRLRPGLHAAHHAARPVEDQRPRQFLPRKHVRPDRSGEGRLPAQAHELPGPHFDFQVAPAQLSRAAGPAGRAGHGLSLRALGRAARAAARARIHAGRCAHLLHAQPDRARNPGLRGVRLGSAARLRLRPL